MAWAKMDDQYPENPKVLAAGDAGAWMHVCAILYANRNLTDGFVPDAVIPRLTANPEPAKLADKLVDVGLFTRAEDGFQIKDYLEYQTSASEVDIKKGWDRKRKSLFRDRDLVQQIRSRDGDHCRYCGVEVNWSDRKGPNGGTYDHVAPRGENSFENVVVACRSCNSVKGARTPDEAGMKLRPMPDGSDGFRTGLEQNQSKTYSETETEEETDNNKGAFAQNGSSPDCPSFDQFWTLYPKKKGKGAAERKWAKLTPADRVLAVETILRHAAQPDWTKDGGKFIPYPQKWLGDARYLDELPDPPARHEGDEWAAA